MTADDKARIIAALEQRAKLCRREANGHRLTGERFKEIRATLRAEAVECIALVGRLEEVLADVR